jgi:hypothetical protein
MTNKKHLSRRILSIEQLETRELFARDDGAFAGYGSLTFSIAPDGTHVGREVSTLQSEFGQVAPASVWEQALAKAFQKWSVHANINFGSVKDDGSASGVYGPTRGDERFGDVRVTGFDFSQDTSAEAVSENSHSVGTWAGDVFFNTAASWNSVTEIEAAALHEVGHILGLGHSSDPASPMHVHGPSGTLELTPQDIANLQAIHGSRKPDPNEGDQGNNSIARSSRIRGGENDTTVLDGFSGNQVWIQFGDLHDATDRDVYEVRTSSSYVGPLTVEVRTKGLSLARVSAEITDRNGISLVQANSEGELGGALQLTLNSTTAGGKYYLQVHAGSDAFWATGDYSITIATPLQLSTDGASIDEWIQKAHRWYYDSNRTRDGFSWHSLADSKNSPVTDDNHTDDSFDRGTLIPLVLETEVHAVHSVVGTVSDLVDQDYFRVVAPKTLLGRTELIVDLESLDVDGLVPIVQLLNRRGDALHPEIRVNGFGQTQLVWSDVVPEQEFVVGIKGNAVSDTFRTGSFSLTTTFSVPTTKPELLLASSVGAGSGTVEREWYIAKPQLFGLSLTGTTDSPSTVGQIWVSIFDSQRRLVTGLVAPLNELRSAPGLFLDAGTYYFQIATSVSQGDLSSIPFQFRADRPSNPVGPLLGPKNVQPLFLCPGSTTEFCYPSTSTPTTVPQQVGPQPIVPLPPPTTRTVVANPSGFFWSNNFAPTNPSNALDITGDGTVDPLDVLTIINALNDRGGGPVLTPPQFLGHLDANANGVVDPLDVLMVINFLNRNG